MSMASHNHIDIILNGHTMVGFADEDPPYDLEFEATSERRIGPAGNVYTLEKALQTATLRVRLAPHSPSTRWFIDRYNERVERQTARVEGPFFTGSISDVAKNTNWGLFGGFIVNVPGFTKPFATYEAELFFERVVPNVAGGRFHQRLEDSAT